MGRGKGGGQGRTGRAQRIRATVCRILTWLAVALTAGCGGGGDGEQPPSSTPSSTATRSGTPRPTASPRLTQEATPAPAPATSTAAPAPPVTPGNEPRTGGLLTVVDKQRALPADDVPPDLVAVGAGVAAPGFGGLLLRGEAGDALSRMLSAAAADGHAIRVRSAYRSYAEQERTFAYWVSVLGDAEARRVSAEAGHSEHQLGTTADLTNAEVAYDLTEAFGDTPGGRWLAAYAHLYGYALSYPAGAEAVTGYAYEPWHYRYIGPDHAQAWRATGLTLVEYLRGLEG